MTGSARVASDLALWRRLFTELRFHWRQISGIVLLNFGAVPLGLMTPLPIKIVVDSVISGAPLPAFVAVFVPEAWSRGATAKLLIAIVILLAVALLTYLVALGTWVLQAYTAERLTLEFRARLFERAQRLSLDHHDRKTTADSLYRIQNDAPALQSLALNGLIPIVVGALTIGSMIYVMACIDQLLAAIALSVVPVLYALTTVCRRQLHERWTEFKNLESGTIAIVHEVLGALRTVKAFGREMAEQDRFVAKSSRLVSTQVKLAMVEGGFDLLVGLTLAIGTGVVLLVGVGRVVDGTLTLGNLLVVMSYLAQLYQPLETMSRRVAQLQSSMVSAQRAWTLLDATPDVPETANPCPLSRALGEVRFENVSFRFPGADSVLHDVTFSVAAGSRVGIVGMTGAGKTTIIGLLMRFYDPDCGRILLDGVDIRAYCLADLRRQFALVLQEPVLFSTTIAENIAYGRADARQVDLEAAAKAANAHDFISKLPDQYEAQVGERGARLSGGERQRIALARAFLRDAPLFVLDEPTSAVDAATEAAIIESLDRLMQGRTTFIITHRPKALKNCNLILHLERGRIAEATVPNELVKENVAR
jgi:ATP-binding cassette, subfamily B, bacterial